MTLLCACVCKYIYIYIYIYEILLYTNKYLNRFKTNSMFHSHTTRNKSDLFITSHNNKLFEHSIAYNSALIYNKLPHKIKALCV